VGIGTAAFTEGRRGAAFFRVTVLEAVAVRTAASIRVAGRTLSGAAGYFAWDFPGEVFRAAADVAADRPKADRPGGGAFATGFLTEAIFAGAPDGAAFFTGALPAAAFRAALPAAVFGVGALRPAADLAVVGLACVFGAAALPEAALPEANFAAGGGFPTCGFLPGIAATAAFAFLAGMELVLALAMESILMPILDCNQYRQVRPFVSSAPWFQVLVTKLIADGLPTLIRTPVGIRLPLAWSI
jgi:hypothetical protein